MISFSGVVWRLALAWAIAGSVPLGVAAAGHGVVADALVVGQRGWPPQHGGTPGLIAAVEAPLPHSAALDIPVFGNGDYPVQPVYAGDLAALTVDAGSGRDSLVAAAAGPKTFTFE